MSFYSATMTPQTLGNAGHQSIDNRSYHLVLVTKYRRTGLTGPMRDRLETLCRNTAAKWECKVLEFNGDADPGHRLLALTPKVLPSAFVNNRKTVTSPLLGKECADRLKRYYGASPYSGVVVTVSSPGAVRPCPCSNNTGAMRPTMSNSRKDRNVAQWASVPPIAGRMAGIAGRMAGATPLNRYALTGGALRRFLVGVDIEPGARIAHEVDDRRDAGMRFYEKHGAAKSP